MTEHSALGLARTKTLVQPYDPRWANAYESEAAILRSVLGDANLLVEHVGSTAVPGLAAKPILDVAIGYFHPASTPGIQAAVESLEYVFHGDQGDEGGLLFIKGPESCRTHHVHVVAASSAQWRDYLAFRDALRSDAELRGAYAEVKRSLAARFPDDRLSYMNEKSVFVEDVLRDLQEPSSR